MEYYSFLYEKLLKAQVELKAPKFPSPCGVSFILIGGLYEIKRSIRKTKCFRLLMEYRSFLSYG